jgi:hypothetical protein
MKYSTTPLIWSLVIRLANYPDRLGPSGKFIDNSTKLTCLFIVSSTAQLFWLLEHQISVVERFRRRYILARLTAELPAANITYFQRKIQLSGFSA